MLAGTEGYRYRAIVEYDGSDFAGWQSQGHRARTVQQTLADAFSVVLRESITIHGAGRTDAGVHARGQVIAFDTGAPMLDRASVQRSVNGVLPEDVSIRELGEATADFDPRRSAIERAYSYRIWNAPTRAPLERHRSWHVPFVLDLERASQAAEMVLGEHDFASFQGADSVPRSSVRRVSLSSFARQGARVEYRVQANAFVRHMVRNLVGQLVEVGLGRCSLDEFREILEARDRKRAAPPAPPQGLSMEWVRYE